MNQDTLTFFRRKVSRGELWLASSRCSHKPCNGSNHSFGTMAGIRPKDSLNSKDILAKNPRLTDS